MKTETSMEVVCPRKALLEAARTVGGAVSGRNPLPILQSLLVSADENGMRLSATDLEIWITSKVGGEDIQNLTQVLKPGMLASPSKLFSEVLSNMPQKGDIALSTDSKNNVHIKCANSKSAFKVIGLPGEEYPSMPSLTAAASFTVTQTEFKEAAQKVLFAVSTDEARAILTGVLFDVTEDRFRMVATDTHRLAVADVTISNFQSQIGGSKVIVPRRTIAEILKLCSYAEGDIKVTISSSLIQFDLPGETEVQIVSGLVQGQYPNYERVIPTTVDRTVTINVQEFLAAVKRTAIIAKENAFRVLLSIKEDRIEMRSESAMTGVANEEVWSKLDGEPLDIAFNTKYILDAFGTITTDEATIELTSELRPGLVRCVEDNPTWKCVLMPMQIV